MSTLGIAQCNLPSEVVPSVHYALWLSWAFVVVWVVWAFTRSRLFHAISEAFVHMWREAEAQHEHEE